MIVTTKEYKEFEKATKNLISVINNDIIKIDIDCKKSSESLIIVLNPEEKIKVKLEAIK